MRRSVVEPGEPSMFVNAKLKRAQAIIFAKRRFLFHNSFKTNPLAFLVLVSCIQGWGATFVWNGGGADANWSTPTNWTGGVAPANNGTAAIVLAGTAHLSPNVDTNWDISSLVFSNNAGAFVLGGSALNIRSGGVTNSSASGQIINNAILLWTNRDC